MAFLVTIYEKEVYNASRFIINNHYLKRSLFEGRAGPSLQKLFLFGFLAAAAGITHLCSPPCSII
jgi:hypothetical protein